MSMFSIGEFSKVTGLTVKTLRFYHEQGIIVPSRVEAGSGYRFYAESKIELARTVTSLREIGFSIADIKTILSNHDDDAEIIDYLETRRAEISNRMRDDRQMIRKLDFMITHQRQVSQMTSQTQFQVEEKQIAPLLVASVRMTGKYSDCGTGFSKIGRKFGRHICGKPLMLYHDGEYREDNADIEPAMPIKKGDSTGEIKVQKLPGGKCLSLMHLGPYEDLSRSYEVLFKHAKSMNVEYSVPTREVFHKGPGMIFKGNPKKYLTEIQLMLVPSS